MKNAHLNLYNNHSTVQYEIYIYVWWLFACTIGSKTPFTPKGGRFSEKNFLHYLDLCYVNPAYHKLEISPQLLAVNQSELKFQEIVFAKSATFGVKGILLPLELHSHCHNLNLQISLTFALSFISQTSFYNGLLKFNLNFEC